MLTALGARFESVGPGGKKTIDADRFFQGMMATALGEHDLLTDIEVSAQAAGQGASYVKFVHPASRYAVIGVAAIITAAAGTCTSAVIALGGLVPRPVRASAVEKAIIGQALGEKHRSYGTIVHNLAKLYYGQEDYARAEPLYRQALAIRKKALGELDPDYSNSLNNLALLYKAQGQYAQAEPLFQRALAIREQALGPHHPDTAESLHNRAALYRDQGQYAQAEPLFRRAAEALQELKF